MQITLNQQDLQKAIQTYLGSIITIPVEVVNLDIKGMRTTEGYTATVDVVLEGQEYVPPARPAQAVITVTSVPVDNSEGIVVDDTLPSLTDEENDQWIQILELLANNPKGINDKRIVDLVTSSSQSIVTHAEKNEMYQRVIQRLTSTTIQLDTVEVTVPTIEEEAKEVFNEVPDDKPPFDTNDTDTTSEPETERVQVGTNILGEPIWEDRPKTTEPSQEVNKGMFS